MKKEIIRELKQAIIKNFRESTDKKEQEQLESQFNELLTRETINDYLYYGYSLEFLEEQGYNYTKKITKERLKELWQEQVEILGSEG